MSRLRLHIATLMMLTVSVMSFGGPVRDAHTVYTQPDGSTFTVNLYGDEWLKICTTPDGCPVTKGSDGWWCYGIYDKEGKIQDSGFHIGDSVPREILDAGRKIPFEVLIRRSREKRATVSGNASATIEAIRKQAVRTKADGKTHKKGLALLVQFNDVKFTYVKDDFIRLLNQSGYNQTGSAKDYYEDQFGENWEFSFDVSEIITLPWPVSHYGMNDDDKQDIRPWEMVEDACRIADNDINFAEYDQDNDGKVDNVYIFYAGLSESEHTDQPDLIWPHQYYIYSGTPGIDLVLDGKRIDRYACSAEITGTRSLTGIGSFCHEYGHTFGLMDLYDTDYDQTGGWAAGTWRTTSLMDGGNYNNDSATPPNFNCIEREMLGLSNPIILEEGRSYMIDPIHRNGLCFRLNTDTEGEYYLFECRSNEGWDKYIGGRGMLVYHIDKNLTEDFGTYTVSKWKLNTINTDVTHQCADLIEADGRSDEIHALADLQTNISGIFFPQNDVTALTPDGRPSLKFWSGAPSELSITGISLSEDNIISFNVLNKDDIPDIAVPAEISFTTFPSAVLLYFSSSDLSLPGEPAVQWKKAGDAAYSTAEATEYDNGKYVCLVEGLESGNVSYEAVIRFRSGNGHDGKSQRVSFMTKRTPPVTWPYMFMTGSQVNAKEGFPLYIENAQKAAEIEWFYNGSRISADGDMLFHPEGNGTIKAVVRWEDGSCDTIMKEIVVQ